jgi:hypothetical protein
MRSTGLRAAGALWRGLVVAAALAEAAGADVLISGATVPTSVAWDAAGRVYVAEKAGVVRAEEGGASAAAASAAAAATARPALPPHARSLARRAQVLVAASWSSTDFAATPVLNISSRVASWGDGGLMAIDVASTGGTTYLYATYTALPLAGAGSDGTCADDGTPGGRPPSAIYGCPAAGVLSRWPLAAGALAGPEEVLIGGNGNLSAACSQFGNANIGYVLASSAAVLFSVGVGANEHAIPDWGQFGGDHCGGGGDFRAQAAVGARGGPLGGKVLALDLTTRAVTTLATGSHNPWRFTLDEAHATFYSVDPGTGSVDEINGPSPVAPAGSPPNFGCECGACMVCARARALAHRHRPPRAPARWQSPAGRPPRRTPPSSPPMRARVRAWRPRAP